MAKYVPLSNSQVSDTVGAWLAGEKGVLATTDAKIAQNQQAATAAATPAAATHAANQSTKNVNQGGENLLQRAMDFLSIGDYAVGGALGSMNRENRRAEAAAAKQGLPAETVTNRGTRYAPDDPRANGFGRDIVAGAQGFVHGIAQGFAGTKAVGGTVETPGSVLFTGKDAQADNAKRGLNGAGSAIAGIGADIVLDPTNLLGPGELHAGITAVKGAAKGVKILGEDGATETVRGLAGARAAKQAYDAQVATKAAAKSAARATRQAAKLGNVTRVTAGASAAETVADRAAASANVASTAAATGETAAAAKAATTATEEAASVVAKAPEAPEVAAATAPVETAAADVPASVAGAEHVPVHEAAQVADAPVAEAATRTAVGDVVKNEAPAAAAAVERGENPVVTAANKLLTSLSSKARTVPARAILDASVTGAKPMVEPAAIPHLTTALEDATKVPELDAAIKEAKKYKDAKAFLAKGVKVDGKVMRIEDVIRKAAMVRITGGDIGSSGAIGDRMYRAGGLAAAGSSGQRAAQIARSAIGAASRIPRGDIDPERLTAAIHDFDPSLDVETGHVLQQLNGLKPDAQEEFLKGVLGEQAGTQFATFDDAIAAAVSGQVESSQMRQMLKALGIRTNATREATLQGIMADKGVKAWQDVLNDIPTTEEALAEHGFDSDTVVAAASTDVDAVQEAAGASAQEAAERAGDELPAPDEPANAASDAGVGPDGLTVRPSPQLEPVVGSANGKTLREILRGYGTDPLKQEVEGQAAWRSLSQKILTSVFALNPNVKGLAAADRGEAMYQGFIDRLTAGEAYLRSHGVMPTFAIRGRSPLYVSFGQILDQLHPDTVKAAFFDLDYRLTKKGEGTTEAAAAAFKGGLSIYPTQFGEGLAAALRGHDAEGIFQALNKASSRNAFSASERGQAALRKVAKEMADPEFKATMQTIHDGQQVIALAFAQRAADTIVGPLASEFIRAVATYGDRSHIVNTIAEASRLARKAVQEGQDTTLLKTLIEQHAQNGILSSLLEREGATARADVRAEAAAGASDAERAAEQARVEDAHQPKPGKEKGPGQRGKKQREKDHATRGHGAENADQFGKETAETQADLAEDFHQPENGIDDIPVARVELLANIRATMTKMRLAGDHIGTALQGEFGMNLIKPKIAENMSGTHTLTQDYHNKILVWALGASSGGAARRAGTDAIAAQGLIKRLTAVNGGVPVTNEMIHDYTKTWWTALASATKADPALAGDDLIQALKEGHAGDAYAGIDPVEGLDDTQAQMALELHELIQEVFEPKNGQLARMQSTSTVLAAELGRHGARSGIQPDKDADLAASANLWRTFDHTTGANPLDDLLTWKSAIEAASVGPATADALTGMAADLALTEGLKTTAEKVAAGWKRIDTARDDTFIVQHLKPNELYPPEFLQQLPYAEHMMQQVQKSGQLFANPKINTAWNRMIGASDFATNILKTSQTIWRPAHHIDNLLGDSLINLMRGVNPLYTVQAPKILKALGQLGDVDDEVIGGLSKAITDSGEDVPEVGDIAATVSVNGKPVTLTHAQVAAEGRRRGVFVTDKVARDALPGTASRGALGSNIGRKLRKNPIAAVDRRLGAFSATRDNLTRTPHFLHVLEESDYPSLEAALHAAAQDVSKWHPSIQQLSTFEQKVARRLFYFYTWQRKTASLVVKTAIDRPSSVTAISKAQFEVANQNGLAPESIGNPTPSMDPRIPSYSSQGLLGPTFTAGYNPLNPGSEADEYGDAAHDWGISLSAPQIDSLQSLFQGTPVEVAISSGNPLITAPLEMAFNSQPETAVKPLDNVPNFLLQQTGTPSTLFTALTGNNGKSAPANGTPQQLGQFAASQAGNQGRVALNYLTGLKFQDYTSLSAQRNAKVEQSANDAAQLKQQGYSDAAIATLKRLQRG